MKNLLLPLLLVVTYFTSAQVGIGTTTPDASAAIEVSSTTSGMLIPRMTETQKNAIVSPATGLLIYQTNNTPGFYYYNGTIWTTFGGADADWTVVGNDMYNANTGNVGVGNTTPSAKFHITGSTTPSSSGGTVNLLNENFTGYTVVQKFTPDASCSTTTGWQTSNSAPAAYVCASCTGDYLYIDADDSGCDQNATVLMSFTPTNNSVDISFDYLIQEYSSGSDSFRAYLHDGTSQVGGDLVSINNGSSTTTDSYFSGSGIAVIASTTYSLRFEYIGSFAYGSTIDNVLVTETGAVTAGSYVFRLEDGQQQAGYVLTSDANGNATWELASGGGGGTDSQTLSISGNDLTISNGNTVTLPSGGGGSYTFDNGLTLSGSNVQLGGILVNNTTIDLDNNDLTFSSSKTVAFPGKITFEGTERDMMITNFDDEYVAFGTSSYLGTSIDGTSFTDSGGDPYTIDVALGVYTGNSGGSGFKMGSIEYLTDGLGELFVTHDFSPLDDNSNSSGTAAHRWDRVFATNGTIQTSDLRLKKNIEKLNYGLNEIMQLETITYNWKKEQKGNTLIPEHLQERKIGFSAQQLLEVLPETVNTHSWVAADEKGNFKRIENKNLGVFYSDVIPVTVKAIQEQQVQIEVLKSEILELKELVNKLISEKK